MAEVKIQDIIKLANKAGEEILKIYNSDDFSVEYKDDNSPLTRADRTAHNVIVETLQILTPNIPILSEEGKSIPFEERSQWQEYWLIDPLDGTKEFVKRNGEFTVNIALIKNHKAAMGVVYAPVLNTAYYGEVDKGAFKILGNAEPQKISVNTTTQNPVKLVGSRSHASESLQEFAAQFEQHEFVSMGSSLKLCLVADGSADIYPRFGLTSEWDTAAAQCVVECAGGYVKDLNLQPLQYNKKDSLLNPYFIVANGENASWQQGLAKYNQ